MDFLKSPVSEPQRVVLLLIVANGGTSRLLLYKWDSWQELGDIKPLKCSGFVLPTEDAFPHLLIPSSRPLSFAIVTGDRLVFYDEITSNHKARRAFNIPHPPGGHDTKLWVQWAKPVRHETHRKEKEDIFLIREDGLLKTAIVTHDSKQRAHIGFSPGNLGIQVDTAVCALPGEPFEGGDILIVCGDTTEGGVFRLQAREFATKVQTLPNWSPVTNTLFLPKCLNSSALPGSLRVLAATGIHDDHAFLTELKYGIEAQIVEVIEHQDATSIDRLWVLHQRKAERQILLTSHHEHSDAICFEKDLRTPVAVGADHYPSLGFDSPTLAACNIDFDSILQITTMEIHVLGDAWQLPADPDILRGRYICANIHPRTGLFVIASHFEHGLQLVGGITVKHEDRSISISALPRPHTIDFVPVSLTIGDVAGRPILIAGSVDGRLHLYDVDQDHGVTPRMTWEMSTFHKNLDDPKISSVTILALANSSRSLVICGFKTGQVMFMELTMQDVEPEPPSLSLIQIQTLGSTAVSTVIQETLQADEEATAYMTCDSETFQVRLYHNVSGMDFTLNPLIATAVRQHHEVFHAPSFNAIAYVARITPELDHLMSSVLVGMTDNALIIFTLGGSSLTPKQTSRTKPAQHVVYSAHLQKVIASVATKQSTVPLKEPQVSPTKPMLQLLDINESGVNSRGLMPPSFITFGEEGEKIQTLIHWAPTHGSTHYEMIVIGSEYNGDGRLSFITSKRLSQGKAAVLATTFITYSKKTISAVCEYGLSSLLVCAGKVLKLVNLDLSTKPPRWEHQAEIELPSRATEIRTKGSMIYIATNLHSYMLIREQDKKFQVVGSDRWAGRARSILPYGDGSTLVNLVSDHGSRILNFTERPVPGARPNFEALVPESIDKIIQVTSSVNNDCRDRFLGMTVDGTVYMFTTLNEAELNLLSFLEELCQPLRTQAELSVASLAKRLIWQHGEKLQAKGVKLPKYYHTHARGDVLKALLTPGPYNMRTLLQQELEREQREGIKTEIQEMQEIKKEEVEGEEDSEEKVLDVMERFEEAAKPVVGEKKDFVAEVTLWLRKLLNVPIF